jgi:hypothetical protein
MRRFERFQGTRVHEGRNLDATVRRESKEDAVTRRITRVSLFTASSLLLFLALPLSPAPRTRLSLKLNVFQTSNLLEFNSK